MKNKELLKQITKFGVVGGIAFVIDYLILIICKELLNIDVLISTAISFSISVIFNYILSIKWVFNIDKNKSKTNNFILFVLLSILGLIITEIIMDTGVNSLKINYLFVKIIATGIVMVFNFITRKIFLEKNKKIKVNSKIISILLAIITTVTLCLDNVLPGYNLMSLIFFIILINFFNKYCTFKEVRKDSFILATLFAFLLVFGNLCEEYIESPNAYIVIEIFRLRSIFYIIGYFGIFYSLLNLFLPILVKIKIKIEKNEYDTKKIYIITFIILLLAWLPYLLGMFPGTLSMDSNGQLTSVIENKINSDHHPIAHTLVIKLAAIISNSIFNDVTGIVLTYNLIQIITLAAIFSYLIVFLYKRGVNKKIIIAAIIYYAITPIFGYYSVVMWKDVLFAAFALWLTIECYKLVENNGILTLKSSLKFIIASLLVVFFRNNAIYVYFLIVIASLIIFKKQYKKLLIIFTLVIGTYYTIKGPVFSYFSIEKSSSSEYIAIPMQQIGRMVYKDIDLTKEERKQLNKIMDVEIMKEAYNPRWSDGIKFNKNYNRKEFDKNKLTYLKLWLKLVIKHPTTAIETYAISTLGYWNPNTLDRAYENSIVVNKHGLKMKPKSEQLTKFVLKMGERDLPLISITWSIGLLVWLVLISIYLTIKRKEKKYIYPYICTVGIWLTIMVATPVYNETRYIFSLYTTLPLLLSIPFIPKVLKEKIK